MTSGREKYFQDIAEFPKRLAVFETSRLVKDVAEAQALVSSEPHLFLAYVEQFQVFDSSFKGSHVKPGDPQFEHYRLEPGNEFHISYINHDLVWVHGKPNALANLVELSEFGIASRIKDWKSVSGWSDTMPGLAVSEYDPPFPVNDMLRVQDESGTIEDHLDYRFTRALTEFRLWMKNYPLITIATINDSKFTDEILSAGKKMGAKISTYRR